MNLKQKIKTAIAILLVGAFLTVSYEAFHWFTHVYEDNARIRTDITNISAQVDGKIESVMVEEGVAVKKGQLLLILHHEDIKLNIRSLQTDLSLERAKRAGLEAEKAVFKTDLASKIKTQQVKIRSMEQESKSIDGRLELANKNLSRVKLLVQRKLTADTALIAEQDKVLALEGEAALLAGRISVARQELVQLRATRNQVSIIENEIRISDIEQTRIEDSIRQEELKTSYRHITSPIDGVVGRIIKFRGEYVEDGVNIILLHDPNLYWVEAYVDESQLRHLRVGQDVLINLSAHPFQDYTGKVKHIGRITTAEMGLGAKVNGNNRFGSSYERVPVRISIDNPPPNLTPGMQADINVRIYDSIKLW
ncbi:MAG: HlyD family secretion protein [Rhodospirillaceae bacterium]|nr:HlyD family secretion protein [Rhodospirillaceae bacterium]MBT4488210.1 HlyD family secretion protein [Rhodospirillaceae bacterium]MBT5456670.1 HlyD family secretion protein [Rhodospirillaceae bacterium]MBT7756952.1 HlyD family secretion protein [Rhodospirillaceae bacterium]